MAYRSDIDGLRAYAVLPVLFYHVGYNLTPGGFVGVDIFFVISGFLITNLIQKQVSEGNFRLGTFYARRIKRLFPALAATIIVSIIVSFLLFTPADFEQFGGSVVFTPIGLSNFYFWLEAGYWDSSKYVKPLLHTWSLAVEEQFYLFWPLLFIIVYKFSKTAILPIIIILSIISVYFAEVYIGKNPSAAFYLMPFRVAEFGIGAALVWVPRIKWKWIEEFILALGLALIIGSIVLITEKMRFPGLLAMIPCLGAAMAIYAGRAPILSHFLSNPFAVIIGKISYSLYLVHWPLIVFWKYYTLSPLTQKDQIIIIILSLALGWVSYKFIEQPFRNMKKISMAGFSLASTGLATILIITSATIWANNGWTWRLPDKSVLRVAKGGQGCAKVMCESLKRAKKDFVIYGDSFGRTYFVGLKNRYAKHGRHFTVYWHNKDCRWFMPPSAIKEAGKYCEERIDTFFHQIKNEEIETIVIAHRWQKIGLHTDWKNRTDFYGQRFGAMMARKEMLSVKKVVLVLGLPEFRNGIDSRMCLQSPKYLSNRDCTFAPFKEFKKIRAINRRVLDSFRRHLPDGVELAIENPFKILCDKKRCKQIVNGHSVYWDKDHLSHYASRYMVNKWTALEE